MTASLTHLPAPPHPPRILTADWIAPMTRRWPRATRGLGIRIEGAIIIAVAPLAELTAATPEAIVEDTGNAILLPGLVNAHVHLELSDATPGEPPREGFGAWLLGVIRHTARPVSDLAQQVNHAVDSGVAQCLRFGVTSVGDITRQAALCRARLREHLLRVTSYGEIQAMARRRSLFDQRLETALDPTNATERLRVGLTPHAPYTVEPELFAACLTAARVQSLPLATHLAETLDEADFLANHRGPFRELWETLGAWDDAVPFFTGGPIRLAQSVGLLDYPTLLAHVNYCDDDEMAILAAGQASVVYCPRTHRYFGHPPHRFRAMLACGINVAIGTDSCASSPNLNLLDDLRLVHEIAPEIPSVDLWGMVTTRGAQAIGAADQLGSLAPGMTADVVAFPASTSDPLCEILECAALPQSLWIGGVRHTSAG